MLDGMSNLQEFGLYLAKAREQRGLSQEAVRRVAGLTKQGISNLESGKNQDLKVRSLIGLAHALHITPAKLLKAYMQMVE